MKLVVPAASAFVLFYAASYWLLTVILYPELSSSTLMLYREFGNDFTYFPLLGVLGNLGLSDANGMLSFPVMSTLPHAVLFKLFGVFGVALADMLICWATFYFFGRFLVAAGVGRSISFVLAALWVTQSFHKMAPSIKVQQLLGPQSVTILALSLAAILFVLVFWLRGLKAREWLLFGGFAAVCFLLMTDVFQFWYGRFPRPFVTSMYLSLCLWSLVELWNGTKSNRLHALLLGAGFSALLQGDIYHAFSIGIPILLALGIRNLAPFSGSFLFVSIPFLYQRFNENPEHLKMMGMVEIARTNIPWITPDLRQIIIMASALALSLILKKRVLGILWVCLVGAFFAAPLSIFVLGKGIQIFHFWESFHSLTLVLCFVIGALYLDKLIASSGPSLKRASVGIALVLITFSTINHAWTRSHYSAPCWNIFGILDPTKKSPLFDNYRSEFDRVTKHLSTTEPGLTLATFDTSLSTWWILFKKGTMYNPDLFTSSLSNAEIEQRLYEMGHLLGWSPERFLEFVSTDGYNISFHGGLRYQATLLKTAYPLSDYTPQDQQGIANTTIWTSFNIPIPISEQSRLKAEFAQTTSAKRPPPDLIILTQDPFLRTETPPTDLYSLEYETKTFKVWRKRAKPI